jgi:hypothetical protein
MSERRAARIPVDSWTVDDLDVLSECLHPPVADGEPGGGAPTSQSLHRYLVSQLVAKLAQASPSDVHVHRNMPVGSVSPPPDVTVTTRPEPPGSVTPLVVAEVLAVLAPEQANVRREKYAEAGVLHYWGIILYPPESVVYRLNHLECWDLVRRSEESLTLTEPWVLDISLAALWPPFPESTRQRFSIPT